MKQVARNLTDVSDGILANSRCLIMDRDTKYTEEFRDSLDQAGVKTVRCPVLQCEPRTVMRLRSGLCVQYKRNA